MNIEAYEAKLDAAAELEGKYLPERNDPECERVARIILGFTRLLNDDDWDYAWKFHTDAYANAMSGGSSLLRAVRDIRNQRPEAQERAELERLKAKYEPV